SCMSRSTSAGRTAATTTPTRGWISTREGAGRLMEWTDEAFVLSARAHGESGAIVELLTESYGRHAGHVAGGGSRKMRPYLQPGVRVIARFRARTAEQ